MNALAETISSGGSGAPVRVGPDGRQLRACGAVRISEEGQSTYSEGEQIAALLRRAHADGYAMSEEDVYIDHWRGHRLDRTGYQAILAKVRQRYYHVIYCYAFDRWHRDSLERQMRGKELDKLGVKVVSLTQGEDEPGIIRTLRAEMDEEEGRKIARRTMPNRRKAAMTGTHMARAPYGFRREYPAWDGRSGGRRPAGVLVPLEPQASELQQMFVRYDTGQWSTRDLAEDLNRRDVLSPDDDLRVRRGKVTLEQLAANPSQRTPWSPSSVSAILRNPVYAGDVTYDRRPGRGHYIQQPSGPAVVVEGKHTPLIVRPLFDRVQQRLAQARGSRSVARRTPHSHVVAGLFVCERCGGRMIPSSSSAAKGRQGHLRCGTRAEGHMTAQGVPCTGAGYKLDLALDALLRDVSRLRGRPWTPERERLLAGPDSTAAAAAALDREIAAARETLVVANRRFMLEIREPTDEDRAAFEQIRREMTSAIGRLNAEKSALQADADSLPRWKALHSRLRKVEVRDLVRRLVAQGERAQAELRDLLTALVEHVVVVERVPERRSVWLSVQVTWTPDVQRLLDAGLLWLDDPEPRPTDVAASSTESAARKRAAQRERQRRYVARRRAEAENEKKRDEVQT